MCAMNLSIDVKDSVQSTHSHGRTYSEGFICTTALAFLGGIVKGLNK